MTLRERGLLLPRRKNGSRRITWAAASYPAVHDFLTTPAYAGAYVFGRTRTEKRVDASGKVTSTERILPQDQWQVLINVFLLPMVLGFLVVVAVSSLSGPYRLRGCVRWQSRPRSSSSLRWLRPPGATAFSSVRSFSISVISVC